MWTYALQSARWMNICEARRIGSSPNCRSFCGFPASAHSRTTRPDMLDAADWVRTQCEQAGLSAEIVQTAGHPIVYAEWTRAAGTPTVLVYGHYDVQPPDPLDQWTTPPFEPTVRDGTAVCARGDRRQRADAHAHQVGRSLDEDGRQTAGECEVRDRRGGRSRQQQPGHLPREGKANG